MAIRSLRRRVMGFLKRSQTCTSSLPETHNSLLFPLSNYCAEPSTSVSLRPSSRPHFSCNRPLSSLTLCCRKMNITSWMSSPVSGPSRFDWDQNAQAWLYRRTKQNLSKILETELEKLCEKPISLS